MIRKTVLAALAGVAAMACAGSATAAQILTVDFTVAGTYTHAPSASSPSPFGLPNNPGPITGEFKLDYSLVDSSVSNQINALTAFDLTVGNTTFHLADVALQQSFVTVNSGLVSRFGFAFGPSPTGSYITGPDAFASFIDRSGQIYCYACTTATGDIFGVPEPATWTMMIGGLFGAGAMLRRRQLAA